MFEIRRMGCGCTHDSSFVLDVPQGYDAYLMLFVRTKAFFCIGDSAVTTEPDTFILYDRFTPLHYGADGGDYINDWILFDSSDPLTADAAVLFDTPVYIGDRINLSAYFQLIADCYFRGSSAQTTFLLLRAMLTEVYQRPVAVDMTELPHYRELLDLRRMIYAEPGREWSMQSISQMLNISVQYLLALYKKAFGITCMNDVIRSRTEQAQQYLCDTGMSIEEIAYACGYSSAGHFSRQFKQQTGLSPLQWRKSGIR